MPRSKGIQGIRVYGAGDLTVGQLLEQLRHAEVMGRVDGYDGSIELVRPSHHIPRSEQRLWAERNVERMATFGITAEVVYEK